MCDNSAKEIHTDLHKNCTRFKTASESRETESRPEASSHGYWIHQLDTRKTARVNFTYVWPTLLRKLNHKWPCAIRSCHNRDMPKISSKYAFAHLQWHNLKSVHPTIVKVYIFGKLFLQGIQKWLYFCGRGKSKNIMADQKLKFW